MGWLVVIASASLGLIRVPWWSILLVAVTATGLNVARAWSFWVEVGITDRLGERIAMFATVMLIVSLFGYLVGRAAAWLLDRILPRR